MINEPERPRTDSFPLTNNAHRANGSLKITNVSRAAKQQRSGWTYTKWALAGAFCLSAALAGTFVGNLYWKSPDVVRRLISNKVFHPFSDPLEAYKPELQFPIEKQHEITLLMLGTDHDYEDRRAGAVIQTRGRSDAMLLAKVNFDTGTIRAFSIPRDSFVHIPDHGMTRINAAYAMGGADLTKETIKSVFGIPVDYYVAFNYEGFRKVIDALGGIRLDVQRDMDYDDNWGNLHIHLKKGVQGLTGYQAMGYVRYRHGDNDMMRAQRQQQFVEAVRERIKSPKTIARLPAVLNAIMDNISTDMTMDQMVTLSNFARTVKRENIAMNTVPVTESPSFVYIKPAETEKMIRDLFYPDGLTPVSVNVPSRRAVLASNDRVEKRHGRHGRGRRAVADIEASENNDALVAPDTNNDMPPIENHDAPPPVEKPETGTSKPETSPKPSGEGTGSGEAKPSGGGTTPSGGGSGDPSSSG